MFLSAFRTLILLVKYGASLVPSQITKNWEVNEASLHVPPFPPLTRMNIGIKNLYQTWTCLRTQIKFLPIKTDQSLAECLLTLHIVTEYEELKIYFGLGDQNLDAYSSAGEVSNYRNSVCWCICALGSSLRNIWEIICNQINCPYRTKRYRSRTKKLLKQMVFVEFKKQHKNFTKDH